MLSFVCFFLSDQPKNNAVLSPQAEDMTFSTYYSLGLAKDFNMCPQGQERV